MYKLYVFLIHCLVCTIFNAVTQNDKKYAIESIWELRFFSFYYLYFPKNTAMQIVF